MSSRQVMLCVVMVGMAPWISGWLGYYAYGDWAQAWFAAATLTLYIWLPTWLVAGLLFCALQERRKAPRAPQAHST